MSTMKFNAWDKKRNLMINWSVLTQSAWNSNETNLLYKVLVSNKPDYEILHYLEVEDKDGIELCEGDLRFLNGKIYVVVFDGFRSRFDRNMVDFGDNESIVINEDNAYLSKYIGCYYKDKDFSSLPVLQDKKAVNFKTTNLQEKDLTVFNQIKECFKSGDEISVSIIQRRFKLGYNAAWRVMDALLSEKIVIPNENKFGVSKFA